MLRTDQLSFIVVKKGKNKNNYKKKIAKRTHRNINFIIVSQEGTSNESPGADVNTNVEPVKNGSDERLETETEHSQESVLANQSVTLVKSNVVERGQVTPAGTTGK